MLTFRSEVSEVFRPAYTAVPSGPVGFGDEQYPNAYDEFIMVSQDGHYHVASDVQTLFNCIEAMQNELGLSPAGSVSTIRARLEASGNLDLEEAAWKYTEYVWDFINNPQQLAGPAGGTLDPFHEVTFTNDYNLKDYGEVDNGWGEGLPVVFCRGGMNLGPLAIDSWGHNVGINKPSHITFVASNGYKTGALWGYGTSPNGNGIRTGTGDPWYHTSTQRLQSNWRMKWHVPGVDDPNNP